MDQYEVRDLKEYRKIQLEWIVGNAKAIQNYMESIKREAQKGIDEGFMCGGYMSEKIEKAKSDIKDIQRRYDLYYKPE